VLWTRAQASRSDVIIIVLNNGQQLYVRKTIPMDAFTVHYKYENVDNFTGVFRCDFLESFPMTREETAGNHEKRVK